jgi:hypothetical protein
MLEEVGGAVGWSREISSSAVGQQRTEVHHDPQTPRVTIRTRAAWNGTGSQTSYVPVANIRRFVKYGVKRSEKKKKSKNPHLVVIDDLHTAMQCSFSFGAPGLAGSSYYTAFLAERPRSRPHALRL